MRTLFEYWFLIMLPFVVTTASGVFMSRRRKESALFLLAEWTDHWARRCHDRIADELDSLAFTK